MLDKKIKRIAKKNEKERIIKKDPSEIKNR